MKFTRQEKIEQLVRGADRPGRLYDGSWSKATDRLPIWYIAKHFHVHDDTIRTHLRNLRIPRDGVQRKHLRRLAASIVQAKEQRAKNVRPYQTVDGVMRKRRGKNFC